MPSTVEIKIWMIEHDVDGRVYLGPYFTEQEANENNFQNIHGWGKVYEDTQKAELCQAPSSD